MWESRKAAVKNSAYLNVTHISVCDFFYITEPTSREHLVQLLWASEHFFFSLQKPLYYCFLFLYYSCQDGGVTMKNESHIRKVIVLLGETEASVLRWKILLEHILLLNVNSLQIVYKLAPAQDVTVCEITFMPTVPLAVAKRYRGRGNAPPCCQNSKDISWGESTQHD